ncbi:hypothetical protein DM02DRAFT_585428 [Periconia macrospinosa]|uniref:Uncharacterized protein n=1 Tax=Periconia macrospinosa TaxID=97972 RepID=A0A2V1E688_9PLEO|nr:hypothetical protein DM02DRAFT_585428 [Periconia macrospinosa]
MAEPMTSLSPEKLNAAPHDNDIFTDDADVTSWHDPPSSPFVEHVDHNDQENIAPTPVKPLMDLENDVPQSAFKISPDKKMMPLKEQSPMKSPAKNLLDDFEREALRSERTSPKKNASPMKQILQDMEGERPGSAMSSRSRRSSPSKSSRSSLLESAAEITPAAPKSLASPLKNNGLRDNEGLTVAMRIMDETRSETRERSTSYTINKGILDIEDTGIEDTMEYNADGPDMSSLDMDDTCFSNFSEMPGVDMTKFAMLRNSPTKNGAPDQTPRARAQMTPSTVRRTQRTPSPTPRRSRKEGDTTNLLLDFTAQFEAFSTSRRMSPSHNRQSPPRSTTEPNLRAFYDGQRSPTRGGASNVLATPRQNRAVLNLLDFELPPAPTPRSVPTVTIRELESLKSNFQSQISSLTASLSGKEAQVESLVRAISDAERRVGEAQESVRDERSAREYAEAQMEDWKKKGEEVQTLLKDVQSELARNDAEREQLLARLAEAEKRSEEADQRSSDLETRLIEAESKNVDMTTFINPDEDVENKKIYSELECQTAIAEKVNEVARDLHTAYKAKHEKKIKALKESYQRKADERCKELRLQIIRLERKLDDAEKKQDTFSKVVPDAQLSTTTPKEEIEGTCDFCNRPPISSTSLPSDLKLLETHKATIESLKAKLAGLESELASLRSTNESLTIDLEAERVEKGELVAAAEQMLAMCGEKMEELQQEEFRKSQAPPPSAPTTSAGAGAGAALKRSTSSASSQQNNKPANDMRSTGFLAGGGSGPSRPGSALSSARPGSAFGDRSLSSSSTNTTSNNNSVSGVAKPSGLRAPGAGGFGFGGASSGHGRTTSSSSLTGSKSRILSNIERMGG